MTSKHHMWQAKWATQATGTGTGTATHSSGLAICFAPKGSALPAGAVAIAPRLLGPNAQGLMAYTAPGTLSLQGWLDAQQHIRDAASQANRLRRICTEAAAIWQHHASSGQTGPQGAQTGATHANPWPSLRKGA